MFSKYLKYLPIVVFSFCFFALSVYSYAGQIEGKDSSVIKKDSAKTTSAFDPTSLIMEHIMDAHEFHFFSLGKFEAKIPLPILIFSPTKGLSFFSYSKLEEGEEYNGYKSLKGKIVSIDANEKFYDISITRNVVQMFISLILLIWIMVNIAKKYTIHGTQKAPSGFQNAVEPVITFVRDEVAKPNLGAKYKKYMPFLLTIFFFILINNLIGLVPGTANVTGNIAFTMVMAVISFIVIIFSTNRHFWMHILWPPGMPILVKLILTPVELLSVLIIKPASLMIRLFANMLAGHIIITCFIMLIFIFGQMQAAAGLGFSPISIAFTVFMYFIEIMVAFLQAFIFTNLTALFIGQSFEGEHHEEHHHEGSVAHPAHH